MRRWWLTPLVATAALSAVLAVVLLAVIPSSPLQEDGLTRGPQPSVLCDATNIQDCVPVKNFDVKTLYKDNQQIDQDHPSRIDFYGQMFQKFPEGTDTMMQKVFKLKKQLKRLAMMQSAFAKKLDQPVQTVMSVLPGEPGRMGARGKRGPLGPPGFMGSTGPQGRPGHPGRPGLPGDEGWRGRDGPIGLAGDVGRQGVDGDRGPVGIRGIPGIKGTRGNKGPPGYAGENGPQGLDGQAGNRGPRGQSPQGPLGSTGIDGSRGEEGPKGGVGARGPPGLAGHPGTRGDAGQPGFDGRKGRDARMLPPSKCGMQDTAKKNVCCGVANVDWRNYDHIGSYMDVNTQSCQFSDDDVMYFTNLYGNGGQWTTTGAQAIYSSSQNNFRVYINQDAGGTADSWWMNSIQQRVKWCGVGVATGPKQQGVCCGVSASSDFGDSGGAIYNDVSTKACQFGGDPIYLTTVSGKSTNGRSNNWDLTGTGSSYSSIGPSKKWFRIWIGGLRQIHWFATKANAKVYDWRVNWCGFGTVFPTGDMRLANKQITEHEYPCKAARMVHKDKAVTNTAEVCCGIEDNEWKNEGDHVSKHVDTSKCCFKKGTVVTYLTSMRGDSSHWTLGGITSPIDPSNNGFDIQLIPDKGSVSVSSALNYNYRMQWCGIGVIDENDCAPAKPTRTAPTPPSPPPPSGGSIPDKSFLNIRCADFRDKYMTWAVNKQKDFYSKCMSQDCEQSMESSKDTPGCRYVDKKWGFCYAKGSTQTWCEANKGSADCVDKGSSLFGGSKAPQVWTAHQNVKEYNNLVPTGKTYNCQCMENCGCTKKKCMCSNTDQKPWPLKGDNFEKQFQDRCKRGTISDTYECSGATWRGHVKKNKDGHCSCSCDKKGF